MKLMSAKQYEETLDEQFEIGDITVIVAWFPNGWTAFDLTNDKEICVALIDKKSAISEVETYTNNKYNPKKTHFI
jgi:hypothetical protein